MHRLIVASLLASCVTPTRSGTTTVSLAAVVAGGVLAASAPASRDCSGLSMTPTGGSPELFPFGRPTPFSACTHSQTTRERSLWAGGLLVTSGVVGMIITLLTDETPRH